MKALRFHTYGGPEVLQIDDVEMPKAGPGEVLVRVSGAGVNPFDWKLREGYFKDQVSLTLPAIVSSEFSGTIEKLGDGVEGFEVGDEIYGQEPNGTCADYIVARVGKFAKKPVSMDLPDSASIPVGGMTAWQALFVHGGVQAGSRVLIHAASGGVGTFAVQLAKWAGATVYATASAKNHSIVRELGADHVIDYTSERFEEVATDLDMVLDAVGGETSVRSLSALKPGGILVSLTFSDVAAQAEADGKRYKAFSTEPSQEQLEKLADLIQDLKVRPVVDAVVPLIRAVEAQKESQTGRTVGKLVVDVRR